MDAAANTAVSEPVSGIQSTYQYVDSKLLINRMEEFRSKPVRNGPLIRERRDLSRFGQPTNSSLNKHQLPLRSAR